MHLVLFSAWFVRFLKFAAITIAVVLGGLMFDEDVALVGFWLTWWPLPVCGAIAAWHLLLHMVRQLAAAIRGE